LHYRWDEIDIKECLNQMAGWHLEQIWVLR